MTITKIQANQIAAALKWISDIATSLHHRGLEWPNATVYNYRVPQLEALAADYEARGAEIERLKAELKQYQEAEGGK